MARFLREITFTQMLCTDSVTPLSTVSHSGAAARKLANFHTIHL